MPGTESPQGALMEDSDERKRRTVPGATVNTQGQTETKAPEKETRSHRSSYKVPTQPEEVTHTGRGLHHCLLALLPGWQSLHSTCVCDPGRGCYGEAKSSPKWFMSTGMAPFPFGDDHIHTHTEHETPVQRLRLLGSHL